MALDVWRNHPPARLPQHPHAGAERGHGGADEYEQQKDMIAAIFAKYDLNQSGERSPQPCPPTSGDEDTTGARAHACPLARTAHLETSPRSAYRAAEAAPIAQASWSRTSCRSCSRSSTTESRCTPHARGAGLGARGAGRGGALSGAGRRRFRKWRWTGCSRCGSCSPRARAPAALTPCKAPVADAVAVGRVRARRWTARSKGSTRQAA